MAALSLTYSLTNGQTADASQVMKNFTDTRDYVNGSTVRTDGVNAMTAALSLSGDPTADAHAVRKAYLDGAHVVADLSNKTLTGPGQADTTFVCTFPSEVRDSHNAFVPTTGIFTAPKTGVYGVTIATNLESDDPTAHVISRSLYTFNAQVRESNGSNATNGTYPLLRVVPYPLAHDDVNRMGDEALRLSASAYVHMQANQQLVITCKIGGAFASWTGALNFTLLERLTIAWLHG